MSRSTRSTRSTRIAAAALTCLVGLSACSFNDASAGAPDGGEEPRTIVLGAIPNENSTNLAAGYEPLIQLIEAETGAQVELSEASDYAGVIEGLIAGNVDMAFLGSFAYVIATRNEADITPLGAVTASADADPGYYSLGITQGDNAEVNALTDFRGKDICFVDPGSTSGFLYPSAGLIDQGVITSAGESDLTAGVNPVYAGGHDASALSVKNGDCEAGFAMQSMVEKTLVDEGELAEGDLKTVWTSPKISGSLFVASNELGPEMVQQLSTVLTEKGNADYLLAQGMCEGECLITGEDAWGVKPVADADYDGVREVCTLTRSESCEG